MVEAFQLAAIFVIKQIKGSVPAANVSITRNFVIKIRLQDNRYCSSDTMSRRNSSLVHSVYGSH